MKQETEMIDDSDIDLPPEDPLQDDFLGDDIYDDFGYGDGGLMPMQKHSDLLKTLTNFDPFLKQTVNGWLGVVWDEKKKEFVQNPKIRPIMNPKGAVWCITLIQNYARPNNIITNIKEDAYKFIIMDVVNEVWLNLTDRAREFGIYNNGDILRVCNDVIHAAQLVLMGAGDGKYSDLLQKSISRQETVNLTSQPMLPAQIPINTPKKGLFGKILSKLKR